MNSARKIFSVAGAMLLVLLAGSGHGDDIEIYYAKATVTPESEPIVMFSLDWRPNLSSPADCSEGQCDQLIEEGYLAPGGEYTFFDILRAVLRKVMDPLEGVKVGLMMNHDYINNCAGKEVPGCSNGGFIALGARSFQLGDGNGAKAAFHAYLDAVPLPQGVASHKYQGKELFFELYRYLSSQAVYNGHVGYTDFSTDDANNMDVDTPLTMWDESVETNSGLYISPLETAGNCSKIFTVNLLFQVSQQEDDSDNELKKSIQAGGLGLNKSTFPDVIGFLNDADLGDGSYGSIGEIGGIQNVTSYFIVDPTKINTTTTKYAVAGGTGAPLPLSDDPQELIDILSDIFKQVLSVSTTFVAASVPVNVFNRAEIIDNVFIALFQPDERSNPFWVGNVKKLRLAGLDTGTPSLVDAQDTPAIAADGRIRPEALTFWTVPELLPPADTDKGEAEGKDGRFVDRGGSGQKIPGFLGGDPGEHNYDGLRQLYFDDGNVLADLDASDAEAVLLQTALGAADPAEAEELIEWIRGRDVDDLDNDGDVAEPREWIMGDPLHSRPLPLNYGARGSYSKENPAIFIAVASNDGFIRMIRNTTTSGAQSGAEVWGFMPQAAMGQMQTLRQNAAGTSHPYTVDGAPVAYLEDTNNNGSIEAGEKAWLFVGMRRGGKAYYALDVTDPESPELLWKIQKDGDFAELGYTFSNPRVILLPGANGDTRPALVFGGGYDKNKDLRGSVGTNDTEGNAVFVVDAETGKLIWKAVGGLGTSTDRVFYQPFMTDSVPSAVSVLDSDGNGTHDRAYVADTGGNLWRVDMEGADTGKWKMTLLARLGRHSPLASGVADDRRFFHRPDVVQTFDEDGPFDAVIVGSGDRADPLDKGGLVQNWNFMIKDRAVKPGTGFNRDFVKEDLGDITNTCLTNDSDCTADLTNGWALMLEALGEKALATSLTLGNTVYFTTYVPARSSAEGACAPAAGGGRLYAVSLKDGRARNNYDQTTEEDERFDELDSLGIPAEVVSLPPNAILRPDLKTEENRTTTRFQTYWFEEENADL